MGDRQGRIGVVGLHDHPERDLRKLAPREADERRHHRNRLDARGARLARLILDHHRRHAAFREGAQIAEQMVLEPRHLAQWTRVAYASDPSVPFDDFSGMQPWAVRPEPVAVVAPAPAPGPGDGELSREDLRRLIVEELRQLVGV